MSERVAIAVGVLVLSLMVMAGCKSKEQQAIDTAKQQAVATNTPQQVVDVDKQGNTHVSIVTPPLAGQKDATVITTVYPVGQVPTSVQNSMNVAQPVNGTANGQPAPNGAMTGPVAPAPGEPVVTPVAPQDVQVPAGTTLPIRVNQTINVKHAMAGDQFTGVVAEGIHENGNLVIPRGTPVTGVVSEAHRRGHFKGASVLSLRLVSMRLGGQDYQLSTSHFAESKRGKGRRTAALIGGGAGVGMLIGGVATGGVGLLVGGLAGGGAGTLLAGATGNRDLVIPAESVVRFRLTDDLSVVPLQQ